MEPRAARGSFRPAVNGRTFLPWLLLGIASLAWLSPARAMLHVLGVIAATVFEGKQVVPAVLPSDFFAFWPAAHIAVSAAPASLYTPSRFLGWTAAHVGAGLPGFMQFFYPPPALLAMLPLAPLAPGAGLLVWTILIALPCPFLLRRAGAPWPVIAAGLLGPASLIGVSIGEFGPLSGCIFIAALAAASARQPAAGALFGLLSLKPQAGLLGPVVLLARGDWRGLATGAALAAALAAAITLITGPAIWTAWLGPGMAAAHAHLVAPFPARYELNGVSVFWMARSLGASVVLAGAAQAAAALAAATWCWRAWRVPAPDHGSRVPTPDPVARASLTVCLTLLVTPYAYVNDMAALSVMTAWLAWRRGRLEPADVLLWLWPVLGPLLASLAHVEAAPLAILLGALRAARATGGIGTPAPACYPAHI
ncbi:MAG TPA: glycosyltransferase family 87 protein [Acidiphilium sp.]|uniref:glycosyltransferase family 87 protein n=1 Tax=unclassified Acidiphilium TaxID=2617493 RepID=UPI0025BD4B89|nr:MULTISPECIES: glycosyltransferase family 87 protein [unclassified Acidiphilium]HQT60565.1 glycosyltransferase family 87 protein [Acidiphilium sp.]HQU10981.1 glycosyltransferase family 87 protein [Acidiphilium sp.]